MKKLINFLLIAILALTLVACNFVSGDGSEPEKVDRKEFLITITYRESATSVEKTDTAKFSLEIGKQKQVEIPKIEGDGTNEALICWVVNGVDAENSVGISVITVKRTENGATVTVGSTTINLSLNETSITLNTKYPVVDVYDLAFVFKSNANGQLTTQNSTIKLGVGQMETINLPAVDTVDNETFMGWVVCGTLAENSVGVTTATISRNEEGVQVVLGDTTVSLDANTTRIEFATQYGDAPVIPPVTAVSYKIIFEFKTNENGATETDERNIQLEIGESRTINLPEDIPTSLVDYWTINGNAVKPSSSATSITVERTEDGIKIVMENKTFEISGTSVTVAMVVKEEEWTPNY